MPTYNFGAFIGETLESILSQLEPGIEVVVLDGGSTDDTQQVVEGLCRRHPAIRYTRQEVRGGIDRDMARSVDLATGEYCWLFSSDDLMRPGALQRALSETDYGLDLYLCGLTLCDKSMQPIAEHRVSAAVWGSVFELREPAERRRYFELAQTTTAFFSFMGSLIFRRARWMEHRLEEAYIGSCWAHVVRFMRMIPDGLSLKYIGESLLAKRGDNDSFMDKGLIHRYSIAIDGYHRIAADVFGPRSLEARHIRRVIENEFPLPNMLYTRLHCRAEGRAADVAELDRMVRKAYSDLTLRNVVRRIGYSRVFEPLYSTARGIYRALRQRGWVPARR
jgi:abequosyltransferase